MSSHFPPPGLSAAGLHEIRTLIAERAAAAEQALAGADKCRPVQTLPLKGEIVAWREMALLLDLVTIADMSGLAAEVRAALTRDRPKDDSSALRDMLGLMVGADRASPAHGRAS